MPTIIIPETGEKSEQNHVQNALFPTLTEYVVLNMSSDAAAMLSGASSLLLFPEKFKEKNFSMNISKFMGSF